jgi:peroxiredoxin
MSESFDAPDVTFLDGDGRGVSLRDFRGRPVLLVFLRWLG